MPRPTKQNAHTWPFPDVVRMTANPARDQWVKKHAGRAYSFGVLRDPAGALATWRQDWAAILEGKPRPSRAGTRTDQAVSTFKVLNAAIDSVETAHATGTMNAQTRDEYLAACAVLAERLPSRWDDVEPKHVLEIFAGPYAHLSDGTKRKRLTTIKTMLARGADAYKAATPLNLGNIRPYARTVNATIRQSKKHKHLTPTQCSELVAAAFAAAEHPQASPNGPAEVLLAMNAGLGAQDLSDIFAESMAFDETNGRHWIRQPRNKNGVDRAFPLWPETVAAIQKAREANPHAERLLATVDGLPIHRGKEGGAYELRFKRLAARAGLRGATPYWLRYTFRALADDAPAPDSARRWIMGHAPANAHDGYLTTEPTEGIIAVIDHVHSKIFGTTHAGTA
ncbi:MAG: hypothetical protein AAGI53_09400 [Planctomycetota bacterium]